MRKQKNVWLFIHLPQHSQCNRSVILVALRRQRSHSLRFSLLATLQLLGKFGVDAYGFLAIYSLGTGQKFKEGA